MEPRFGSYDNRLAVYVQRSTALVNNTVFTIATKFDDCLSSGDFPRRSLQGQINIDMIICR